MSETVNWGILGAANFALEEMAPAIHAARGARLRALATSSEEKAAPFRAFAPDLEVFTDYDALLADPEIDAVYLPLPNHMHVAWAERAMRAGKHVLVEKPVAMAAGEIDGLIALRDETGLHCHEAYMIAHHPQWTHVRDLLGNGAIGALRHVDSYFCFDNTDADHFRNQRAKGGGSLPDIGVYAVGSTLLATGQMPREITHADLDYEDGIDATARASARFDGFSASWMTSMRMHRAQSVTFLGQAGTIRMEVPFNPGGFGAARVDLIRDTHVETWRWPGVEQYVLQVEAFGRALRDGADYPWSLEQARDTQSVLDAIYARGGRR